MSTGKIELSVGAVKIADKNEMFTEEEINNIDKIPVIEDELEETVKFEIVGEGTTVPPISGGGSYIYDDTEIREMINEVNESLDNTIQLYLDKKKEIKGYPITSPDRVIDENGVNIKDEIEEINSSLDNISIQLDEFIVNGESDYTNAFIRANAILSNGGTILLSCKEYNYSDIITLSNNVSLMCLNGYATLKALNLQKSCIKFGNNSRLENLILSSETTSRDSLDTSTKLHTKNADNVRIRNVVIDGANSAGMLFNNMTNFVIENCVVRNTKADGIHITNGCKNGIVQNNFAYNVGDDGIACVSYLEKGSQVENVVILNNIVDTTNARGISNIGSKNITIKNNNINGTNSAGIIVAHESGYNTYSPVNTIIAENTITDFSKNFEHAGILITGFGDSDKVGTTIRSNAIDNTSASTKRKGITVDGCSNVIIVENSIYNSSHCIRAGNYANTSSTFRLKNVKVSGNRCIDCASPIFLMTDYLEVSNNNFINTRPDSGRHMFIANAKFSIINNNTIIAEDESIGIAKIENLYSSIVGYNNASVSFGFTSDKNPYTDSYEWDNKIMEGQGVTIPLFNPSGGHRCGKFGTMAVSSDGTSLKVRVGQNTWKTIQMT